MRRYFLALLVSVTLPSLTWGGAPTLAGARLKDLASLEGVRDNQLMGYGVVVGLAGTGDKRQTVFSVQALTNILRRMGVTVDPAAIQVRNIAAVMVTANLPAFAQPGTKIDITASAIGDAANLQGGMLLMTSLKGADGEVYAVAQGPIVTGGFAAGRGGAAQSVNHPTVGRLPDGAIVEKMPPSVLLSSTGTSGSSSTHLKWQLRQADFTTAARIAEALNKRFAKEGTSVVAKAESSALVAVDVPPAFSARLVEFVAEMEALNIEPDRHEKIIVNERSGTIVLGKDVRISPVSILHGSLTVEIQTQLDVSQPEPLSNGQTVVVPNTTVKAKEARPQSVLLKNGATVEDLVRGLQAIGSSARDIISILQSMKAAGAIDAVIEVI